MEEARARAMIETMAEMQVSHNRHVHPDWLTQGYEYYRAVWVECAELLDHFGWKWWKKQEPDLDQVKLEIVDIWHFGLSDLIRANALEEAVPALLAVSAQGKTDVDAFRLSVETLAEFTLTQRAFVMEPFAAVLEALPMPFTELFELYVGKNVLNNFRQDHGYKTGEYQKLWHGREDNEHLVEVLRELDCPAEAVPAELYQALTQRYPSAI
ncbi:MAG: dUTP diphosphatase [Gammaproteobacteria bacterium]|nr:dUTP diphosphatase [Gammaproteobacteria bacterium]